MTSLNLGFLFPPTTIDGIDDRASIGELLA